MNAEMDKGKVERQPGQEVKKDEGTPTPARSDVTPDFTQKVLANLANPDPPHPTETGQRYERKSRHAEGGMGQVWVARDTQLCRDIALKELRWEHEDLPALRRRFLAEAQITGQLEHPGIVPVYEMVESKDEPPFYTMRLIQGDTLTAKVRDYHDKRRKGEAGPVELRDLLQAFVSVCSTLAYAHSRSVVHRDLKGANIILGPFGEVLVLDWGIAKVLEVKDETVGQPAVQLVLTEDGPEVGTRGELGTLGYMAPEQARGQVDLIDPRTDVFGLGAVLYEILTGQPPYRLVPTVEEGRERFGRLAVEAGLIERALLDEALADCSARPDVELADLLVGRCLISPADKAEVNKRLQDELKAEVLGRAQEGQVVPPRTLAPWVPRALEAVCLKALARQREDRYDTALELADEVKRWLSGEPVRASAEPWPVRAGRWIKRHRTLATAIATALVVGGSVWGWMEWQEGIRQALEAARMKKERNNQSVAALVGQAEAFFRVAMDPTPKPDFSPADLAISTAGIAAALLEEDEAGEKLRERLRTLRARMEQSGLYSSKVAGINPSMLPEKLANALKEARGNPPMTPKELANALKGKGELDEPLEHFRKAVELKPEDAVAQYNLATALLEKGQLDEALEHLRKALPLKPDYGPFVPPLVGKPNVPLQEATAQTLRQVERFVEIDRKLPDFLNGKVKPANDYELVTLPELCQQPFKRLYVSSARFWHEAFTANPRLGEDLKAGHRYNAARAAALAGCGQGEEAAKLDNKERTRWRNQALDWLRADLALWSKQLDRRNQGLDWLRADPGKWSKQLDTSQAEGQAAVQQMQAWQCAPDLAGLRDKDALANLPEAERAAWGKFWDDVASLLARASDPKKR